MAAPTAPDPESWQAYSNLPPFPVPSNELRPWFDTALVAEERRIYTLRTDLPWFVDAVRHYQADPETCCAHFRDFGLGGAPTPDEVRALDAWGLLRRFLELPHPAFPFGMSPYAVPPTNARPRPPLAAWVRVRVDAWRLPPRTRFPGPAALRQASIARLVRLAGLAIAEHRRFEHHGPRAYRDLTRVLERLRAELDSRGPAARQALLALAEHPDPHVRAAGGRIACDLGEEALGVRVLAAIADDETLLASRTAEAYLDALPQAALRLL